MSRSIRAFDAWIRRTATWSESPKASLISEVIRMRTRHLGLPHVAKGCRRKPDWNKKTTDAVRRTNETTRSPRLSASSPARHSVQPARSDFPRLGAFGHDDDLPR